MKDPQFKYVLREPVGRAGRESDASYFARRGIDRRSGLRSTPSPRSGYHVAEPGSLGKIQIIFFYVGGGMR